MNVLISEPIQWEILFNVLHMARTCDPSQLTLTSRLNPPPIPCMCRTPVRLSCYLLRLRAFNACFSTRSHLAPLVPSRQAVATLALDPTCQCDAWPPLSLSFMHRKMLFSTRTNGGPPNTGTHGLTF